MSKKLSAYPYASFLDLKKFLFVFFLALLSYEFIDIPVTRYFSHYQSFIYPFGQLVAIFFSWKIFVIFIAFMTLLCFLNSRFNPYFKYFSTLFSVLILGQVFLAIVKISVGRSRPDLLLSSNVYTFHPFTLSHNYLSFPSGHTISIIIWFFYTAIVFPKFRYYLWTAGLMISFFRVLFLKHFLSDWFFTVYLSICLIPLGLYLDERLRQTASLKKICKKLSYWLGMKKCNHC
jgi:hypothetical protein